MISRPGRTSSIACSVLDSSGCRGYAVRFRATDPHGGFDRHRLSADFHAEVIGAEARHGETLIIEHARIDEHAFDIDLFRVARSLFLLTVREHGTQHQARGRHNMRAYRKLIPGCC